MSVNDNVLSIRNAAHNIRSIYFLPWVVGFWLLSISFVYDFGPNDGMIAHAHYNIQKNIDREKRGLSYDKERDLYYKALVGNDGTGSRLDLINAVIQHGSDSYRKSIYGEITFISILIVFSLILTAGLIRFPRLAEIHFDRQRGIVYTWRFGKIAACRFENLGFREDKIGLTLFLYGESKKHKSGYWPALFGLQPTGKAHMNSEDDNTFLMAQLFAFMDKGKQAVITGEQFQRAQPKTYLFQDNKPKDFEKRLEAILEREHQLPEIYAEHTF
ncbi:MULTISPECIES: hypothetical protein [unclassified Vibrio]|uniref:hypothetical protein n=1 Tax=unclassified Vibrio TaxID=2614977 RepID=UPI001360C436|nr:MULTISPECIES: hypothetical protein [unclassified Vibrio]NAW56366.1 hypothetical protein [Vibrio sp. V36_P2S2PM302]NAX27445.1 hypothetical protein [Vibrio sp. V38_P2S17PM301]NAX29418.1 hypothetical protein [Vibrio sp. V37_P2S8PM304]